MSSKSPPLLVRLAKRQDVHLEQAISALLLGQMLLGQTEQASRALEMSREYEAIVFIRDHSQGSPDLLPGLCLYTERGEEWEVTGSGALNSGICDSITSHTSSGIHTMSDRPLSRPSQRNASTTLEHPFQRLPDRDWRGAALALSRPGFSG